MNIDTQFLPIVKSWIKFHEDLRDQWLNDQSRDAISNWGALLFQPVESTCGWCNGQMSKQSEILKQAYEINQDKWSDPQIRDTFFKLAQSMVDEVAATQYKWIDVWFSWPGAILDQSVTSSQASAPRFTALEPYQQWNSHMNEWCKTWEQWMSNGMDAQKEYLTHMMSDTDADKPLVSLKAKPTVSTEAASHH